MIRNAGRTHKIDYRQNVHDINCTDWTVTIERIFGGWSRVKHSDGDDRGVDGSGNSYSKTHYEQFAIREDIIPKFPFSEFSFSTHPN